MSAQAQQSFLPRSAPRHVPVVTGHEVGGPIGDMHRVLANRLAAQPEAALSAQPLPADERLIQLSSRVLGYALLAAGFVATGWLIF